MAKQPSLTIFIGNKETAIHQVLAGSCTTIGPGGKLLNALFEVFEDNPEFQGEINEVSIASGYFTPDESFFLMRQLAKDMRDRTGEAARFFLANINQR